MIFENAPLSPPLNQYVEAIFHYKHFKPDHSIERVVPTGHIYVIFELDGFERHTYDNDTLQPNAHYTKVWISGQHRHYISISAHQDSEMFVIQFKPYGAFPFFHFPMQQLTEQVVDSTQILGNELVDLQAALLQPASSAEKFSLAQQWLTQRYNEQKLPPQDLISLLTQLQQAPVANHYDIIENYPSTQKHLINQFKKYVGLTPKYYHRILRFNEILGKIKKEERLPWAQVAYDCGYSDQSHFIKEFRHFSGFNPQEFLEKDLNNDEGNFFPLDREES
ncbi:MAG TPA: AraC family transcriptional regulator [Microscillaceae bacterium]|nr:AraC family transcriptional regulator [Microscillaceae bacterium]